MLFFAKIVWILWIQKWKWLAN